MSDFNDTLDFKGLEKELSAAVAKDAKYQRENDAKFRAIHQKVQSYEEFRDIVEASHLKPLDRVDKIGGMSYQKWNALSTNKSGCSDMTNSKLDKGAIKPPQTSPEFLKTWKHQCSTAESKYTYLVSIDKQTLLKCFAVECPLGEIISCINSNGTNRKAEDVLLVLDVIRKAKRFNLQLDFLSTSEQTQLKNIFCNLKTAIEETGCEDQLNELQTLCGDYKMCSV